MVGATSSTVNRKLEAYFKSSDVVSAFLSGFSARISGATTTTTNTTNTNTPYTPVNIGSVSVNTPAVLSSPTDFVPYTLNGNQNIFSIKGNVSLCSPSANPGTLTLGGVRTLVVEGNLTINCNLGYAPNDTTSSWAFIVK